jgi:LysM repeat protein
LRRTTVLLLSLAAASGGFLFTSASTEAQALPSSEPVAAASDAVLVAAPSVVRAQTPSLAKVTVRPGDTLWGIGVRTHRQWPALASYNRILNPDLVYVGQVITIPPASYQAPVYVPSRSPAQSPPVVSYQPKRTYSTSTATSGGVSTRRVASSRSLGGTGVWGCIAAHESGGNSATNTGNGYYGAFQDTIGSWRAAGGGPGLPSDYSYSQQLAVNQRIQAQQGWSAWPSTSRMCGA